MKDDDEGILASWQLVIMVATAAIVLGIWFGYHVAFGQLAGADALW
jgi:hypothetical protein